MVNLERALTLSARLSGHLMLGHVDATGKIVSIRPEGNAILHLYRAREEIRRHTCCRRDPSASTGSA